MAMDQSLREIYDFINAYKFNNENTSFVLDQNLVDDRFKSNTNSVSQNCIDTQLFGANPLPSDPTLPKVVRQNVHDVESHEDYDFSDVVLKYISEMLMEEDMEEKTCMYQESSAALQAAEKSFYEVIGEKYPPSPSDHDSKTCMDQHHGNDNLDFDCSNRNGGTLSSGSGNNNSVDPKWDYYLSEYNSNSLSSASQSSYNSGNGSSSVADGLADSPVSTLRIPEIFSDSESIMQFKRGFEEASKFLPNGNNMVVDLESKRPVITEWNTDVSIKALRGRKNPHPEDVNSDCGRSNKQTALYNEPSVSEEMFDKVLLSCGLTEFNALREVLQNGANTNVQQNRHSKGSNTGKARGKKQGGKKGDVVDLRTLLTLCAQAVAASDRRNANDLLKQIRQHSSLTGDGMQRMAHYFADGLEARLAGAGTEIYTALITKPTSAAVVLKAYHLFLAACPFRKLSNFFSNKTIMNLAENATKLHIIDFGIMYGFQWPCLIQRLSSRPGGPPKLRITGIDLPQPGFRPAERVEETGRRLAKYAETFRVPFEFNAIAQKWDTIQMEDLKIDKDEVLVVNCMYRFRNLLDETVVVDSPRDKVLKLIRKMKPDALITGIVNGAHSAPFFITRFREALFFFSTLFDMLDATVPREIPERMLIEREILGREAMNVVACEGAERIERPETYKQWTVRNMRAGFTQLPLDGEIMKMAKERVQTFYHKDFVIDEDGQWLLQGWKGRIVFALSSWRPSN